MIETHIVPPLRDLGEGFQVRRALPHAARRRVGPFVFFDQMGPAVLGPGQALDVRPHPHIGLATVTWLFEGEILHRDSLGSVQPIRPGEVNWMTAGRGIVHSERTPDALRGQEKKLHGIQTWLALPRAQEEAEPAFTHEGNLPIIEESGVEVRVILGDLFGLSSPVPTYSPTFYAEVAMDAARRFALPAKHDERGLYVVDGAVEVGGSRFGEAEMLVFEPGAEVAVHAQEKARFMLFGGAPLDGDRLVWWNFASSRRDRVLQAADDWKNGRFPKVPGDEEESIPLPAKGPRPVDYP